MPLRGWLVTDFDSCECGDYRHQHDRGLGRCQMPNDGTHGFKPCLAFRLSKAATEIPEAYIEPRMCDDPFCRHRESAHKAAADRTDYGRDKVGHCSSCCDPEDGGSTSCDHDFVAAREPAALLDHENQEPDLGHHDHVSANALPTSEVDVPSLEGDAR